MSAALPDGLPVSIVDLFTIGIGPSSSHTVGPMRAARDFAERVANDGRRPGRVGCTLHGSLALTGRGHATDSAILLGLAGWAPEMVDPDDVPAILAAIRESGRLDLAGSTPIGFEEARDLRFDPSFLAEHPNGMKFRADFAEGRAEALGIGNLEDEIHELKAAEAVDRELEAMKAALKARVQ